MPPEADTPPPDEPVEQQPLPPRPFRDDAPDHFAPSWLRFLFVVLLATGAFFIPQEIALEWYPLNNPGNDIHYLEATLRTSNTGTIRLVYDCGFGFVPPYDITIPVAPSDMAFTYTFPLPDGPVSKLFIDPPDVAGELEFTRLRIINRREEEVRNFSPGEFKICPGLQLQPTLHGWKLVADEKTSFDAGADVDFMPVRPVGMNLRNLKRCLLSWGYLSFMLWLIVLAIYFIFLDHRRGKDILRSTTFLLLVCALMSVVGNRGLIKNTRHIAGFAPVKIPAGHALEMEVAAEQPSSVLLSVQPHAPLAKPESLNAELSAHPNLQTLRFSLSHLTSAANISFQLPPGRLKVMPLRLRDGGGYTALEIPVSELNPPPEKIFTTTAGVPYIQLEATDTQRRFELSQEMIKKITARLSAPPRTTP